MQDFEKEWEEFWKGICTNDDGTINLNQIQRELYDYSRMLKYVPEVYCHVTRNRISKPLAYPSIVTGTADECIAEEVNNTLTEIIETVQEEIETSGYSYDAVKGMKRVIEIIKEFQ